VSINCKGRNKQDWHFSTYCSRAPLKHRTIIMSPNMQLATSKHQMSTSASIYLALPLTPS